MQTTVRSRPRIPSLADHGTFGTVEKGWEAGHHGATICGVLEQVLVFQPSNLDDVQEEAAATSVQLGDFQQQVAKMMSVTSAMCAISERGVRQCFGEISIPVRMFFA